MLYPNPANLVVSIQRVLDFDAAPDTVECIVNDFPSDPVDIEKAVLSRITYRHDWDLYGMPWHCPTIEQVLERSAGDCKARALVLASILDAKEIDYLIHSSPTHIWVQYESKQENSVENAQVEFYEYDHETGDREFRMPDIGGHPNGYLGAAVLDPNARWQKDSTDLRPGGFDSGQGDSAQEKGCATDNSRRWHKCMM